MGSSKSLKLLKSSKSFHGFNGFDDFNALSIEYQEIRRGFLMFSTILLIPFIIVCLLLILIVLLQAGKGGGLAGAFGGAGGQTFLGARGAADFLSKLTIYLAIAFMFLSFILSLTYGRQRTIRIGEEPATVETTTEAPAEEAGTTQEETTTSQPQAPPADEGAKTPSSEEGE
jgi:preprotein translocase subunit SecG